MQNIPKKQKFRSCFINRPGYSLITSDLSACELRILACMSKDKLFVDTFLNGEDLHRVSAARIFNVAFDMVTSDQRNASKALTFGLCISEDTELFTSSGNIKIKDCLIGDKIAHDIGEDEIIDKKFMGEKDIYEIETKYGYTLGCTKEHVLMVIDSDGNYVEKKLCDVDIKTDYVCLKSGSNLFNDRLYKFDTFVVEQNTNYKHFELPKYLDEDWAAFLGLFVAEGSLLKVRNRDTFSCISFGFSKEASKEFILNIDKLFLKIFKDRFCRTITDTHIRYNITSVLIAEWLYSIFKYKDIKTDNIFIPTCVKRSPSIIQTTFIKWLMEGDGTAKNNGNGYALEYSSKSIKLMKDLQNIFINFGIISSIRSEKRKKYPGEIYYVLKLVSYKSRLNFMKDIGFVTDLKNNKCISNVRYNNSVYKLPYQMEKLKSLIKNIPDKLKTDRTYYDTIYNCLNYTDNAIGDVAIEKLHTFDDFLNFIYKNNIITLPIKSITKIGKKNVYDISVLNRELFLANGFIVHNCYGLSKYGLATRLGIPVEEADDMINKYFRVYSGINSFLEQSAVEAISKGYTRSISGRKRYYDVPYINNPDYNRIIASIKRQAKNAKIQGCLVANTNINGIGFINNYEGKEVKLETGFGKDTAKGVYSGIKDVYELKFSNGVDLGITLDHEIPTVSKNGNMIDKKVTDLDIKDDVFMIPLNSIDGEVTDLTGYKYKKGHWRETYKSWNLPSCMDEKLAFVIGCLIGDGSYTKHNHIRFVCQESQIELFNKFNTCVYDIFGYHPVVRESVKKGHTNKLFTSQVSSVEIRGFLKHIGLNYSIHEDKVIPEYFFTETLKNKYALLNGLFSTDGGVTSHSGPNYTTVSKTLANDIHNLLFSVGINSNLKTYFQINREVYRLQIFKRFNKIFYDNIGFSVNYKNEKLIEDGFKLKFGDRSIVPEFIPKLLYKIFKKYDLYTKQSIQIKAVLNRCKHGKTSFGTWRKLYNLIDVYCDEKVYLSKYLNFDFCKLKSINYIGKRKTYDLICDTIHYFTANGVIVHNSNADIIKQAMIDLLPKIESYYAKLLLTVHDEIVVEVRDDQKYEVAKLVDESMISGYDRYFNTVPMLADALIGPCWLKSEHEKTLDGTECGGKEMMTKEDEKYGTKIVCKKCGESI